MPRVSDVIVSSQRAATTDLAVARRGRLRGITVDVSNDALLQGVDVRLFDAQGSAAGSSVTDASGTFEFADLRAGPYRVEPLLPRGYSLAVEPTLATVSAGQETWLEIEMCLAGRVAGRVVDQDTGEAVGGATVRLYDSTERLVGETVTDADGQYAFTGLPEDKYHVETTV